MIQLDGHDVSQAREHAMTNAFFPLTITRADFRPEKLAANEPLGAKDYFRVWANNQVQTSGLS
jgi:hypothetical protein